MCRLIESAKLENGRIFNTACHNERIDRSMRALFGLKGFDLREAISIPENCRTGLYKCRVVYDREIRSIEFLPYQKRVVHSLKKVRDDSIDYSFKYENRDRLERLFRLRETCDDIIIIKDGLVTDSFAGNLVFFDGRGYYTPSTPLLCGVKRAKLLREGVIREADIREKDIEDFKAVRLVNALLDLNDVAVDVSRIY